MEQQSPGSQTGTQRIMEGRIYANIWEKLHFKPPFKLQAVKQKPSQEHAAGAHRVRVTGEQ